MEARYGHQVWTLEVPLDGGLPADGGDVDRLVDDFHELHERVFAVRDPGASVEILQCRGRLVARPFTPALRSGASSNGRPGAVRRRRAYFDGHGELDMPVIDGEALGAESTYDGPMLVTEPTTTVVVPTDVTMTTTRRGNYVLELR